MVALAHAVGEPGAVVVKEAHAAPTLAAVTGTHWLVGVAQVADTPTHHLRAHLHRQGGASQGVRGQPLGREARPARGSEVSPWGRRRRYLVGGGWSLGGEGGLGEVAGIHAAGGEVEEEGEAEEGHHHHKEARAPLPRHVEVCRARGRGT